MSPFQMLHKEITKEIDRHGSFVPLDYGRFRTIVARCDVEWQRLHPKETQEVVNEEYDEYFGHSKYRRLRK